MLRPKVKCLSSRHPWKAEVLCNVCHMKCLMFCCHDHAGLQTLVEVLNNSCHWFWGRLFQMCRVLLSSIAIPVHWSNGHNYLSHCYSIAWDRFSVKSYLSALLRSQFLFDFDGILHRSWGPQRRNAFIRGSKSDDSFPYFAPFFTPVMHFQLKVQIPQYQGPWTDYGS